MLALIVLAILVAHAPLTTQASATRQPPASPPQRRHDSLVHALETHERARAELQARLDALRQPTPTLDPWRCGSS